MLKYEMNNYIFKIKYIIDSFIESFNQAYNP